MWNNNNRKYVNRFHFNQNSSRNISQRNISLSLCLISQPMTLVKCIRTRLSLTWNSYNPSTRSTKTIWIPIRSWTPRFGRSSWSLSSRSFGDLTAKEALCTWRSTVWICSWRSILPLVTMLKVLPLRRLHFILPWSLRRYTRLSWKNGHPTMNR